MTEVAERNETYRFAAISEVSHFIVLRINTSSAAG